MAGADYWVRHVRQPVRFADGMRALAAAGIDTFVEVGPRPTLITLGRRVLQELPDEAGSAPRWFASVRPGNEWLTLVRSLAGLHAQGAVVDWDAFNAGTGGRKVVLPTYPFERERHWVEERDTPAATLGSPTLRLLAEGSAEPLVEALAGDGPWTEAERDALPKIVDRLIARHRRESVRESGAATDEAAGDWLYRLGWREQPRSSGLSDAGGAWLILADRGGLGDALARQLRNRGRECRLVYRPEKFARLVEQAQAPFARIIYLWGLDEPWPAGGDDETFGCGDLLALVQALGARPQTGASLQRTLWIVTRGAQPAAPDAAPPAPVPAAGQAALWGLGRTAAQEQPAVWGGLIDLDPGGVPDEAARLLAEITGPDEEDQIALRGEQRLVARLARAQRESPDVALRPGYSYLITGGLGGVGRAVASWMVDRGARHLVLTGRSGAAGAEAERLVADLRHRGATVLVERADVTRRQELARVLTRAGDLLPPLRGIVHAAGVLDDGLLARQTPERFAAVMRPKALGAWHLHTLSEELPLDFFICFSSTASLLGSPGQANYAAANACLDALCAQRRALGLPALSIGWSGWAGTGMASRLDEAQQARWRARGLGAIEPEQALDVLGGLLGTRGHVGVLNADWARYDTRSPLLAEVGPARDREAPAAQVRRVNGRDELVDYVRREVARALGHARPPALSAGFADMGMDSLTALTLRTRIETDLQVTLPATLALEYPTVEALAGHLADCLEFETASPAPADGPADAELDRMAAALESMSEEDAEALLRDRLDRLDRNPE